MMLRVPGEITATDRNSLYSTHHKFSAYYNEEAVKTGNLVPYNVWCESCQMMCAIDMVQHPGFTKFWCTGEFHVRSPIHNPASIRRCGFSIMYWNGQLRSN